MDEFMFPAPKRGRGRSSLPTAANEGQSSLFGDEPKPAQHVGPATRSTDPETSHTAEARANNGLSLKQLAVLDLFQRAYAEDLRNGVPLGLRGLVDDVLIRRYRLGFAGGQEFWPEQTDSGLRTRRKELVTLGYLADSRIKRTSDAGGPSTAWELTPDGRAFPVRGHLERLRMRARGPRGGKR